jgi:hypothetical protein
MVVHGSASPPSFRRTPSPSPSRMNPALVVGFMSVRAHRWQTAQPDPSGASGDDDEEAAVRQMQVESTTPPRVIEGDTSDAVCAPVSNAREQVTLTIGDLRPGTTLARLVCDRRARRQPNCRVAATLMPHTDSSGEPPDALA